MATTKIVNQSILFPTAKHVDIATKIEFLYCFASEILSKQLLDGVHFAIQDGGPKSFPFKWKHWFLVSERSQLSKNVFGYNSPQKSSESFFLDVATLTNIVVKLAKDIGVNITTADLSVSHRLGRRGRGGKPRTNIAKFVRRQCKTDVMRNKKRLRDCQGPHQGNMTFLGHGKEKKLRYYPPPTESRRLL